MKKKYITVREWIKKKIMKLANMMIHRLMYSVAQDGTIGFVQTVNYYQS